MLAPYSSKSVWNEYLRSAHTIEGIGAHIDNLGGNLQRVGKVISHSMSDNAEKIVASQETLTTILQGSMRTLDRSVQETTFAIEDLRAEFSYNVALLIDQVVIQNSTLDGIKKTLDKIYEVTVTPMRTQARELYLEGCNLLQLGLLDKALEYFHRSETVYDADFFTQLNIGKLYLYGVNDDCDIIDIEKAEKHLRMAVRYGKAVLPQKPEMAKPTAEACLHASMADYLIAMKKTDEQERAGKLHEALNLAREGYALNRNLSEAAYHLTKYSLMLGTIENDSELITSGLKSLDDLIAEVPEYSIKVSLDRDLDANRDAIDGVITAARDELKVEVRNKLDEKEMWDKLSAMDFSVSFIDTNKLNETYGRLVEYEQALHRALEQLVRTLPFQLTNTSQFRYETEHKGGSTGEEHGFFRYENKKWQRIHELFSAMTAWYSMADHLYENGKKGLQWGLSSDWFFSRQHRQKGDCVAIDSYVNRHQQIQAEVQNKLEIAKLKAKSLEEQLQRNTYLDSYQVHETILALQEEMPTLEEYAFDIKRINREQKYFHEVLGAYTEKLEHIEKSIREKSCIVCSKKPKIFDITLGEKKIPLCRMDRPMKWKLR